MLNSQSITFRSSDIKDIVFGFMDTPTCDSDCILFNYIMLQSKTLFIVPHSIRLNYLCLKILLENIKSTFQIERSLARKNNKLLIHENKWKPLLQVMQQ